MDRLLVFLIAGVTIAATGPLVWWLTRRLTAPWRTLAERYPGTGAIPVHEAAYVTARFRVRHHPLTLTRCVVIGTSEDALHFRVIGFYFLLATLREIVIPRRAITCCSRADFVIPRQILEVTGSPVQIIVYGRGAKFLRSWWCEAGAQGSAGPTREVHQTEGS